jgi:hypothetical protein
MTPVKDLLTQARAVIERGWCQGSFARDAQGQPIKATDPLAETFCIRGATRVIAPNDDDVRARAHRHLEDVIIALTDGDCDSIKGENQKLRVAFNLGQLKLTDILASYNDDTSRTQAEILAVFDAAIKLADPTS